MSMMRIIPGLLLMCAAAQVAVALTDGLLINGDFEKGPNATQLRGTEVIGRYAIPQWEISGFVEYIESGHKQRDMLLVVPEGHYAVRLGNEASIRQRVRVTKGLYYSLTFSAARTCAQEEQLNVTVTPDSGMLPIQTVYCTDGWDTYAWAFKASSDVVDVVIHNPGVEEDPACGPLIDAIAMTALSPARLTNANLMKNADFENGPFNFPNNTCGVLIPPNIEDGHSPLPGWMVESLKAVKYVGSDHFKIPHGKRAVELLAGKESALSQVVRTMPGKLYSLTFSVGDAGDGCEGPMMVEAYAARSIVKIPYTSTGKGGFKRALLRFTATSERTRVLFLSSYYTTRSDGALCGPVIDDIVLLSVRKA